MTTATLISLKGIVNDTKNEVIFGTKIKGGTEIDGLAINFPVANTIRKLKGSDVSFAKAEVYYSDFDMEAKGYLFKKDGKELFIAYNKNKKQISELVLKDDFSDEEILQATILLIIQEELVDINAKLLLKKTLSKNDIALNSEEATDLALLSSKIQQIINNGVISIDRITDDEYEYDEDSDLAFVLQDILQSEEEKEEKEEIEVVVASQPQADNVQDQISETFEQASLFEVLGEEETVVVNPATKAKTTKKASTRGRKKKSVEEEIVEIITPKITREEALSQRKKVNDDAWALAKLRRFGLSDKFIKICMEFRRLQREGGPNHTALTPEQILMIPDNGKYTGWTEPIKHGLAALLTGKNLIIRGETSTGKTTLTKTICAILNYPMTFAGASMETSLEDLIGINTLENGNVGVKNAPLITAMIEGGVFYLDEGNAAMPSVLIRIHSAIDDERMIFNQLTGEEIHANPNFRFVTCCNDGYEGTNEMNDATIDRLVAIETKYMKQEDLELYLKEFPGIYSNFQKSVLKMGSISDDDLLVLCEIAKALQLGTKNGLPEKMGSLRNINALYDLIKMLDIEDAIKMIVRKYPRDERAKMAGVLAQVETLNMTAEDILAI